MISRLRFPRLPIAHGASLAALLALGACAQVGVRQSSTTPVLAPSATDLGSLPPGAANSITILRPGEQILLPPPPPPPTQIVVVQPPRPVVVPVVVVEPPRPVVVIEPPRPVVVVEPPRPVIVVAPNHPVVTPLPPPTTWLYPIPELDPPGPGNWTPVTH
jgi:hypothetical protein